MTTTTAADPTDVLRDVWGYDAFRPLQSESIDCVMNGRDSLTVLPTGGGKSLCFQVPAVARGGLAVVVSPLISLMKDQVDALTASGVPAAFINSTQGEAEKAEVAARIRGGQLRLLYVAPERLVVERTMDFLERVGVDFFAIDEAHCVSQWGHDFRPEYRQLGRLKSRFPDASVHAYTATASGVVRDDIVRQLHLSDAEVLVGDFDRPNLTYRMVRASKKRRQIAEVIGRHPGESGIVYCISRKEVDQTAEMLRQMGHRVLPYHAGLDDHVRKQHQDDFINDRCDIVVATVAFGMGIDKPNVRYVVHSGMPKSIEHYQQESGRAGRDGLESECVLIHGGGDAVTWKRIMDLPADPSNRTEAERSAAASLEAMEELCTSATCRHRSIVEYFGQRYSHDSCGACDVCLDEVAMADDPVVLSQKILSCVWRVEQRFGAAHVGRVLLGSRDRKVLQFGHDKLSTYGLLRDQQRSDVRGWIDQLVSQGFLKREGDYQSLVITVAGMGLLKGNGQVRLTAATPKSSGRDRGGTVSWEGVDRGLFDSLRELRQSFATAAKVPAYVVFGDATLREFARTRPSTLGAMAGVPGVGQKKLADYGSAFLERIDAYAGDQGLDRDVAASVSTPSHPKPASAVAEADLSAGALAAMEHFDAGRSVEEVASAMGRATSTVGGYLMDYVRVRKITDVSAWVDDATRDRVLANRHHVTEGRIKPLFDALGGEVSYEQIRVTLAAAGNEPV